MAKIIDHGNDQFEIIFTKPGFPMIVTCFALFDYCVKRYPKREIVPSAYVDHNEFYYYNRKNELRLVQNKTEIWIGAEWPRILRRR